MRFNENQLRAVSHKEGPMLVLAGPGSGKTTVITGRIQTLINKYNVPPGNILAVTFSRAAAAEMASRFESLFTGNMSSSGVHFATIHSIFLRILKDSGRCGKLKLISEREKQIFIRTELEKLNIHTEDTAGSVREILLVLSRSKSGSPASALSVPAELLLKIINDYTEHMKHEGLIDFDDILIMCRNLLYEDSSLLKRCRDQYRYILVDEFQDVSPVQYETLQMLEGLNRNIFVVGDDDQSIYGFRGAAPSVIRRFLYDHPDADTVSLNINYRSVPEIVAAASAVKEPEH